MSSQLSLSARPRTLDQLVGQKAVVEQIRGYMRSGHNQKAWLLVGPTGVGKTTSARILAVSFQCEHQTVFGCPCKACYEGRHNFDIVEHDAAKLGGKADLESALDGASFAPRVGRYRVYIIDEVHKASEAAQSLMLRYLEDDIVESTVFILCTTNANKLLDTAQSRCALLRFRELGYDDTLLLVERLLKRAKSELPADRLVEQLVEKQVNLPRFVTQAVEKYVAGALPQDAADVVAGESTDTKELTRACIKGNWPDVARQLSLLQKADMVAVRLSCLAYLTKILLGDDTISERTKAVAEAIQELCRLENAGTTVVSAGLAAALYRCTSYFSKYKR